MTLGRLLIGLLVPVLLAGCRTTQEAPTSPVNSAMDAPPVLDLQRRRVADIVALQSDLAAILNRHASTGAFVSARVVEADTGLELFKQDDDRPVIPASNMKLPISAAALDQFGPDYQWKTQLLSDGKNLWLIGFGDPALGDDLIEGWQKKQRMAFLDDFANALKKANTTSFENLYVVDDFFDAQLTHPTWEQDDLTFWYAAPVGGLNLNGNCIDVTVVPTEAGEKPRVIVVPATFTGVEVLNHAVTVSPATTRVTSQPAPDISREQDRQVYTVTGAVFKQDSLPSKPVVDPGMFAGQAVRAGLEVRGVKITGITARKSSQESQAVRLYLVAQHASRMEDILRRVNQNSQNMFTEACAKLLSPTLTRSWENGSRGVRAFFARHKIDATGFSMADGSGLSRQNKLSARLVSDILLTMHRHQYATQFKQTLAVGGRIGTIRNRFRDMPDRVFAKTGMIRGVRSLSGYVTTDRGKVLVFSFIYNDIPGNVRPFEVLQDDAVTRLMKWE